MNIFSRWSRGRTSSGRELSPETDIPDHTPAADGNADFRDLHPDDVGGSRNRRRDTTRRWAHSSGGRRPWEANPRRPSNGRFAGGRRPPQPRDTFWDTQRPPAPGWMSREEDVADGTSNGNAMPRAQAQAQAEAESGGGSHASRFRDVDIEFNDNNVDDISSGARVVTGFHAGRDFKARISGNTFGRPN